MRFGVLFSLTDGVCFCLTRAYAFEAAARQARLLQSYVCEQTGPFFCGHRSFYHYPNFPLVQPVIVGPPFVADDFKLTAARLIAFRNRQRRLARQ